MLSKFSTGDISKLQKCRLSTCCTKGSNYCFITQVEESLPIMLQSNVVYKINCPVCNTSYVGQVTWHLLRRFKKHTGNMKPDTLHFDNCNITPSENMISIIRKSNKLPKLLTLKPFFISTFYIVFVPVIQHHRNIHRNIHKMVVWHVRDILRLPNHLV